MNFIRRRLGPDRQWKTQRGIVVDCGQSTLDNLRDAAEAPACGHGRGLGNTGQPAR